MVRLVSVLSVLCCVPFAGQAIHAQTGDRLSIHHADDIEYIFSKLQDTTLVTGAVIFETKSGMIYCDSAVWLPGKDVTLRGRVIIDDKDYRLAADDSVRYNLFTSQADAYGSYVELLSRRDSLFVVGQHAFYDRQREYFYMLERPTLFLNYPDSADMIEVIADYLVYDARNETAEATGDVRISSKEITAFSGCAVMYPERNTLDLFDNPVVHRGQSQISGRLITITSEDSELKQVDVIDSAYGEFVEPVDSAKTDFDRSILSGDRITLSFDDGTLRRVSCYRQAYSWYYPSPRGKTEVIVNSVSGDSIQFTMENEELIRVDVMGGAVGTYLSTTESLDDTVVQTTTDTIDYAAEHITYDLSDSLITLRTAARTTSDDVALEAHMIELDTREKVVEAFSGQIESDSTASDNLFAERLQPNEIPVVLRDKKETLFGDYLRYSIDTQKGRIVTSKSRYQTGYFYGDNVYRQNTDIFYLDDGRYTTCDADEPHFHFHSKHLKLIEGDKLVARPVVFSIGRLPILAVPYYVFPLKKGRHSGFLPFTLGNIERGERYVRNVGYYWAASQYWDWQGALDYIEERHSLNFFNRVAYRKLYSFDGTISANWARETSYSYEQGCEKSKTRWTLTGGHNHEFSPSFRVSATGHIQSDALYYNDFSIDLDQRLNRVIRSQVSFIKKFGSSVSLSGKLAHDDHLDTKSRTDQLPVLGISLPAFHPFGSGRVNEEGQPERRWYNALIMTYRPALSNFSSRKTPTSITYDTVITVIDTVTMAEDTVVTADTTSYRSRRKYTRVDHSIRLSFPTKIARYVTFNPSLSYDENWYKIYQTDQSDAQGIDASTFYRAYVYSFGSSISTKLYGTVYPNVLGLVGLRQVITPRVTYAYRPKIDRHPTVSGYTGGGARSSRRSQSMTFSLNHVYQAKVKRGEIERNLELVSITSTFSYDFERDTLKLSEMSTSFRSNLLPKVNFYGNARHSLYNKGSGDLDFWHPRLLNFSLNAGITLRGQAFLFDDLSRGIPRGADSLSQLASPGGQSFGGGSGWSLSASYGYSELNRGTDNFRKKNVLRFTLLFNLTPVTRVTYSQYYDFVDKKTVNNEVNIQRQLHCWTGIFHWVPTGSNRGWGFRLYVTALPEVKIDNSQGTLSTARLQGMR